MRAFSSMSTDFLYLLLFSKKKGSKWGKNSILYNMEIFSFSCDFDGFFSKLFLMKIATKNNTSFEDNARQNDHLYCRIMVCSALNSVQHFTVSRTLLCPAHYCVQHIFVSSKILCPHLPKRSFVHLSHFNVLRSYCVLAKHLRSGLVLMHFVDVVSYCQLTAISVGASFIYFCQITEDLRSCLLYEWWGVFEKQYLCSAYFLLVLVSIPVFSLFQKKSGISIFNCFCIMQTNICTMAIKYSGKWKII